MKRFDERAPSKHVMYLDVNKKVSPKLTPPLNVLKASPQEITEECLAVLERFVVLFHDRTSSLTKVNEAQALKS